MGDILLEMERGIGVKLEGLNFVFSSLGDNRCDIKFHFAKEKCIQRIPQLIFRDLAPFYCMKVIWKQSENCAIQFENRTSDFVA